MLHGEEAQETNLLTKQDRCSDGVSLLILNALVTEDEVKAAEENKRKREQSRTQPFPSQPRTRGEGKTGQAETAVGDSFIPTYLLRAYYVLGARHCFFLPNIMIFTSTF